MTLQIVREIAEDGFRTAMEILQIVEVMERQNTGRINGNLGDGGAARAGIVVRNGLTSRLVILVAGAFSPVHQPGDRHLRQAVDLLQDPATRAAADALSSPATVGAALQEWQRLEADHRRTTIKHFRDKFTAHTALPKAGVAMPSYGELFGFARDLAAMQEQFASATGTLLEKLSETEDFRLASAQSFWEPWELMRTK